MKTYRQTYILLSLVLVLMYAVFVRTHDINTVPPGLWYDEAINGLDAISTVDRFPHIPLVYATEDHPREPLFVWLIAGCFRMFGESTLTMRLVAAAVGFLTVLAFFFLAREYFGSEWALAATFVFAAMRWNFHINRLVFRANLMNLFAVLSLLFFLKFYRRKKISYALFCGIFLGMGFYTYLSFCAFAMFLILCPFAFISRRLREDKAFRKGICVMLCSTAVIFLPLCVDYIRNPEHLFARAGEVGLFAAGTGAFAKTVSLNAAKLLFMFVGAGDVNQKFNVSGMAMFNLLSGGLFYCGLIRLIVTWKKSDVGEKLLLFYFIFALLPSVFSADAPHSLRAFGAVVPVALIITVAHKMLFDAVSRHFGKIPATVLIVVCVTVFGASEYVRYFVNWADDPRTYDNFNTDFYEIGRDVKSIASTQGPDNESVFYISNYLFGHPTFRFETSRCTNTKLYPLSTLLESNTDLAEILKLEKRKKTYVYLFFIDFNDPRTQKLFRTAKEIGISFDEYKTYKTPSSQLRGMLLMRIP